MRRFDRKCLLVDGQSSQGRGVHRYSEAGSWQGRRSAAIAEGDVFMCEQLFEKMAIVGTLQVSDAVYRCGEVPASGRQNSGLARVAA
jgi:hypothetical protein